MVILRFTYVGIIGCIGSFVRAANENYLIDNVDGVCVTLAYWGDGDDDD
jgi:hypothetical protein